MTVYLHCFGDLQGHLLKCVLGRLDWLQLPTWLQSSQRSELQRRVPNRVDRPQQPGRLRQLGPSFLGLPLARRSADRFALAQPGSPVPGQPGSGQHKSVNAHAPQQESLLTNGWYPRYRHGHQRKKKKIPAGSLVKIAAAARSQAHLLL